MTDNLDPLETAKACAAAMLKKDNATRQLGMKVTETGPGIATIEMTVRSSMLNGHKTCHGGFIFTLADSAFAFACNSYNKAAVAAAADISFLAPAYFDDVLTARASETHLSGRSGVYDVTVTNAQNQTIALFRGKSRIISQTGVADAQ